MSIPQDDTAWLHTLFSALWPRFSDPLVRILSCVQVPASVRLKAIHEAETHALELLTSRFPSAQGFSVKLKHENLPAFPPPYFIGTLERIQVRRGWTSGLNALLDATADGVREVKLVIVRASRLESLVQTM